MSEQRAASVPAARIIKHTGRHAAAPPAMAEQYRASLLDLRRRLLADVAAIEMALGLNTERTRKPNQSQG
jgi:hypothetical protein